MDITKPIDAKITVNELAIIKQIVLNKSHSLELVREMLSNMCAIEVGASFVKVVHFEDPEYGPSFIFEDDGIGMDYQSNEKGRLNKFINVGFGKIAGEASDEFGYKGLGAKLILDSKSVEILTWNGKDKDGYRVIYFNPRLDLLAPVPEMPKIQIITTPNSQFKHKGTTIKVLGYEDRSKMFELDYLERYIYWYTIVGTTKTDIEDRLPKIFLRYGAIEKPLEPGYPWIVDNGSDWKTVTTEKLEKNIVIKGKKISIIFKGGFSENTKGSCKHKFSLTQKGDLKQYGVRFASKGIPYFLLDMSLWKHDDFQIYQKFVNIVIEGDELWEYINIDRNGLREGDELVQAFKNEVKKCFKAFVDSDNFQNYLKKKKERRKKGLSKSIKIRKDKLSNPDCEYIFVLKDNKEILLHHKPEGNNEKDVLAVLWKLEALGLLPFEEFVSVEHTTQKGMDIIANFTLTADGEPHLLGTVEVENYLSKFTAHGHEPKQTSLIVCWEIKDKSNLKTINNWLYLTDMKDANLYVAEIKNFPNIIIKKRKEFSF